MAKYRVVYTYTECAEDWIDAESFDDAEKKWDSMGYGAELFFIEDENGDQMIYN